MKMIRSAILCFLVLSAGVVSAAPAGLKVEDARVFLPIKGSSATAGFGKWSNSSVQDIELSIVSAAGFKAVELHESYEKDGKAHMRKIDSLKIPAKASMELKPGGHHIMLFDPTQEIAEGSVVEVQFRSGKTSWSVPFPVVPRLLKK